MQSTTGLKRAFIAVCLMLALGVAPALTVSAQQPAQAKRAPEQAQASQKAGQKAKAAKQEAAEEDVLLSDTEMENVKGGIAWFVPVAISAAIAGGSAYLSHRSHQKLLRACTTGRR